MSKIIEGFGQIPALGGSSYVCTCYVYAEIPFENSELWCQRKGGGDHPGGGEEGAEAEAYYYNAARSFVQSDGGGGSRGESNLCCHSFIKQLRKMVFGCDV